MAPIAALDGAVDEELAEAVSGHKKKQETDVRASGSGAKSGGSKSYFICDWHWRYGSKAYRCDAPQK